MKCLVECCGTCDHYHPKDVYDEDGDPAQVDMGLCDELDAIVYFHTPGDDCDFWEEGSL